MKELACEEDGEKFMIVQAVDGGFFCPVCGAGSLPVAPYDVHGAASLEICGYCRFHFGFDDSPLASNEAVDGIRANWRRWRRKLIDHAATDVASLSRLEGQLRNIGVRLAFDLIDIDDKNA